MKVKCGFQTKVGGLTTTSSCFIYFPQPSNVTGKLDYECEPLFPSFQIEASYMKSRDLAEKVLHDLQALIIYQFDQLVFRLSGYIDHNDGVCWLKATKNVDFRSLIFSESKRQGCQKIFE